MRWQVKVAGGQPTSDGPAAGAPLAMYTGEWWGDDGAKYTVEFKEGSSGTCVRESGAGAKEFLLHESDSLVWWGSHSYFCEAAELAAASRPLKWYAAKDTARRRPCFVWRPATDGDAPTEPEPLAECTEDPVPPEPLAECSEEPASPHEQSADEPLTPPPGLFPEGRSGGLLVGRRLPSEAVEAGEAGDRGAPPADELPSPSRAQEWLASGVSDMKARSSSAETADRDTSAGSEVSSSSDACENESVALDTPLSAQVGSDGIKRTPLRKPQRTALRTDAAPFVPLPFVPAAEVEQAWRRAAAAQRQGQAWSSRGWHMNSSGHHWEKSGAQGAWNSGFGWAPAHDGHMMD